MPDHPVTQCSSRLLLPLLLQYGGFRSGYAGDKEDTRVLLYGMRYILENYVFRPWTEEDVEKADLFYRYPSWLCLTAALHLQQGPAAVARQHAAGTAEVMSQQ